MPSLFSPTSPLRRVIDVGWIVAFLVVLALLLRDGPGGKLGRSAGLRLDLIEDNARFGLFSAQGSRIGEVRQQTERRDKGWRVRTRVFAIPQAGAPSVSIGWSHVALRQDLSLRTLALSFTPKKVRAIMGRGPDLPVEQGAGHLTLSGSCRLETGACTMIGSLGNKRIEETLAAGRGPVLEIALLPLLARGVLGKRAELQVFEPFTLRRRFITYELIGHEAWSFGPIKTKAIRVKKIVGGEETDLWIDTRGRLLEAHISPLITLRREAWHD